MPTGIAASAAAGELASDTAWLASLQLSEPYARLVPFVAREGDVLYEAGKPGHSFVVVLTGSVNVLRDGETIATLGPGSIVGELALLTGETRSTTVVAASVMEGRRGTVDDFDALLGVPEVLDHLTRVAAKRLAANVVPISFTARGGFEGILRPLLPGDRADYLDLLARFSPESRRLRFFSSAQPSAALVNYLLGIDYLNHFALVVLDPSREHQVGVAVARLIRSREHDDEAEVAFGVVDGHQGQGFGSLLLGCLGAVSGEIGVTTLTAEVLDENTAMRKVFDKAGARWHRVDRGVVGARMVAADAAALLDVSLADEMRGSVHGLGAASLAALKA